MRKSPNAGRRRRVIPAISVLGFLVLLLTACAGGSSPGGSKGSATSANLTWWGWTPSVQVAQQYIKAFNKKYPDIHITYKMLTIAGYNAALRPALASSVGPDVFDVAPGAANGSVETYSPDAALTIWKQMFSDGIMEKGALGVQQYPDANNDFMSGKYAMVMMGTWYMQYDTTSGMSAGISGAGVSSPKNFTAIPILFPDVAGTGTTGALYGDSDYGIAVNTKSSHQAAAVTFATWLGTS